MFRIHKRNYWYLMCSMLILVSFFPVRSFAEENLGIQKEVLIDDKIPLEAYDTAQKHYKNLIKTANEFCMLGKLSEDTKDYLLGNPFMIFNSNTEKNEVIYYFPLILNEEIIAIVSTMNTSEGWTASISKEFVNELNSINYLTDNTYIFYQSNGKLFAKNIKKEKVIGNIDTETIGTINKDTEFLEESYMDQVEDISKSVSTGKVVDVDKIREMSISQEWNEEYTPSFSTSTNTSKVCSLYNKKKQGKLPICWAASVATIVNYRKGTNYSAKNVCNKVGTGYVGVGIDTKKKALAAYGLSYTKKAKQSSWASIVSNIKKKYPIAASTFTSGGSGHAVTIYGYRQIGVSEYIVLWNSGSGASQIVYYKAAGSTYTYNNKTWTWTKTLSYK